MAVYFPLQLNLFLSVSSLACFLIYAAGFFTGLDRRRISGKDGDVIVYYLYLKKMGATYISGYTTPISTKGVPWIFEAQAIQVRAKG